MVGRLPLLPALVDPEPLHRVAEGPTRGLECLGGGRDATMAPQHHHEHDPMRRIVDGTPRGQAGPFAQEEVDPGGAPVDERLASQVLGARRYRRRGGKEVVLLARGGTQQPCMNARRIEVDEPTRARLDLRGVK